MGGKYTLQAQRQLESDPPMWTAIQTFAHKHGRNWRTRLSTLWMLGADVGCDLQRARNVLGPSGLWKIKIDVEREKL